MVLRGPAIDLVTFRWTLLTRKSSIQRRLCNHITLLVIDEVRCTAHVLYQHLYSPDKGAGSYLAGMAVAIPILNVDGRRHTNNFSKNI